jgi:hypothetical protein
VSERIELEIDGPEAHEQPIQYVHSPNMTYNDINVNNNTSSQHHLLSGQVNVQDALQRRISSRGINNQNSGGDLVNYDANRQGGEPVRPPTILMMTPNTLLNYSNLGGVVKDQLTQKS